MDDDSSQDSDYVPDDEIPKKRSKHSAEDGEGVVDHILTEKRKRKVAELWDQMQQDDRDYVVSVMDRSVRKFMEPVIMEIPLKRRRQYDELFLSIIGSKRAASTVSSGQAAAHASQSDAELRQKVLDSIQKVQRKTVVQETRKFAGQEVM